MKVSNKIALIRHDFTLVKDQYGFFSAFCATPDQRDGHDDCKRYCASCNFNTEHLIGFEQKTLETSDIAGYIQKLADGGKGKNEIKKKLISYAKVTQCKRCLTEKKQEYLKKFNNDSEKRQGSDGIKTKNQRKCK